MKITFEDKSFLEIKKDETGQIVVSLGSRVVNPSTQQKVITVSTANISMEQFQNIVKELSSPAETNQ